MSAATLGNVGPWIFHPKAGIALMKAHNWLRRASDSRGVNAFDLVRFAVELHADLLDQSSVIELLADVSPGLEAALELAFNLLLLDRMQTVAVAGGIKVSPELVAKTEALRRGCFQRPGGAA